MHNDQCYTMISLYDHSIAKGIHLLANKLRHKVGKTHALPR